jgi:hypothetical protein
MDGFKEFHRMRFLPSSPANLLPTTIIPVERNLPVAAALPVKRKNVFIIVNVRATPPFIPKTPVGREGAKNARGKPV